MEHQIVMWKTLAFVMVGFIVCLILTGFIFRRMAQSEIIDKNQSTLVDVKPPPSDSLEEEATNVEKVVEKMTNSSISTSATLVIEFDRERLLAFARQKRAEAKRKADLGQTNFDYKTEGGIGLTSP